MISPNPEKTSPQKLHEKWLRSLPDHTIVIYTDGSKLVSRTWRDRLLGAGTGATLTLVALWLVLVSAAAAMVILRA